MGTSRREPLLIEDVFLGLNVHEAAPICSAAHRGRQVLLSASTEGVLGPLRTRSPRVPAQGSDGSGGTSTGSIEASGIQSAAGHPSPPPICRRSGSHLSASHRASAPVSRSYQSDARSRHPHPAPGSAARAAARRRRLGVPVRQRLLVPLRHPSPIRQQYEDAVSTTVGAPPGTWRSTDSSADRGLLLLLDNFEHVVAAARLGQRPARGGAAGEGTGHGAERRSSFGEHELPVPPLTEEDALELLVERAEDGAAGVQTRPGPL